MNDDWNQKAPTRAEEIKRYISAEEKLAAKRNLPPEISDSMAKSVSSERRVLMEEQVKRGVYREKGSTGNKINGSWDLASNSFIPGENNQPDFSTHGQE